MRRPRPSVSSKWAWSSPAPSWASAAIATIPPAKSRHLGPGPASPAKPSARFSATIVSTAGPRTLTRVQYYIPDVRSIIEEAVAVSHLPGVAAMMAKDEASRGLGIELIDQG